MEMSLGRLRIPAARPAAALVALGLLAALTAPVILPLQAAQAGPTTLPWSDGDDDEGETVTDVDGTKVKMTREEKQARAEALAPTLTAMLTNPDFPAYAAPTTRLDVDYVVFLGGFHLSSLSFSATVGAEDYEIRSNIHTDGLVDKIVRTNANIGSKGVVSDGRIKPALYNSDITDKNQRQLVAITYDDVMPSEILSFPRYNLEKHPVSDLDKRRTVDPVSAILQMGLGATHAISVNSQNPCGGTIPIFDGRRRFDLTLEYEKTEEISAGREGAYDGEAIKCWVGFKRIAGYKPDTKKKKKARRDGRSEWPDVYLWLAPVNADPVNAQKSLYVPVRLQARTPLGSVVLRAVKLETEELTQKTMAGDPAKGPTLE